DRWARLCGPAGSDPGRSVLARRAWNVRAGHVSRQGRRGRRQRDVAPGPARHAHERKRDHVGRRGPGQRDLHGHSRLPAQERFGSRDRRPDRLDGVDPAAAQRSTAADRRRRGLARAGADLLLGGREQFTTVMFTDLRGFTASAENMPAEEVIAMLNEYLGEMSDAVLAHGGTLISYMGDGIMAVFGAPIEQD